MFYLIYNSKMFWKNLTKKEIDQTTNEIIQKLKDTDDLVAKVPLEDATWDSVIKPLLDLEESTNLFNSLVDFPQYVSSNKEIRDASNDNSKKLSDASVESSMRVDVYQRVKKVQETMNFNDEKTYLKKRLVDKWIQSFERQGLDKDKETRTKIEKILKEISNLAIEFDKNLGEENTNLEFTKEELSGMKDDFLKSLEFSEDTNKYTVTLKYPHIVPISEQCWVPETRKIVKTAFDSRCIDTNTDIIEKMIVLRDELAEIMGFSTTADYVLDVRMAKNHETVINFLEDLNKKLDPLAEKEMKNFLDLKRKDHEKHGLPMDDVEKFHAWDYGYYTYKNEERECDGLDQEIVREYFPIEKVTEGILELYQELLGLTFKEIKNTTTENSVDSPLSYQIWDSEVRLFEVSESSEQKTAETVGYFYLDMHPREGKFAHAAQFDIQKGCVNVSGFRQYPVAACVCNFPKPDLENPKNSCLSHSNVTTFFHEFGHVMHELCSKVPIITLAGTTVERDAVEAPSQMLENWCFVPEILQRLSFHYETGSAIPMDLCEKLKKSKQVNAASVAKRQLVFGIFDQTLHTLKFTDDDVVKSRLSDVLYEPPDNLVVTISNLSSKRGFTQRIFGDVQKRISGIEMVPGTNMTASFGHIAHGYEASYYGYKWSQVYSCDMFSRFENNPMDKKIGMEYRTKILEKGSTQDFMEYLVDFLGREPNQEAFLRDLGL
jgi:thimet oligopeptidase